MVEKEKNTLLRVEGASNLCGVSVSTLNKLRIYGNGPPYFKIGRAVVYDTADITAWLETCRRTSTKEV